MRPPGFLFRNEESHLTVASVSCKGTLAGQELDLARLDPDGAGDACDANFKFACALSHDRVVVGGDGNNFCCHRTALHARADVLHDERRLKHVVPADSSRRQLDCLTDFHLFPPVVQSYIITQ